MAEVCPVRGWEVTTSDNSNNDRISSSSYLADHAATILMSFKLNIACVKEKHERLDANGPRRRPQGTDMERGRVGHYGRVLR